MNRPTSYPVRRRAATLIEVLVVVVIMSVLAVTAAPAISTAQDVTRAAAVREVRRLVEFARAHAIASGSATGVVVNTSNETVTLRMIVAGAPEPITDGLGGEMQAIDLAGMFGGADLASVGGGIAGGESLWFDFDGTPHRRDSLGQFLGVIESEVVYTFGDGGTVRVSPVGGMVK